MYSTVLEARYVYLFVCHMICVFDIIIIISIQRQIERSRYVPSTRVNDWRNSIGLTNTRRYIVCGAVEL